MFLAKKIFQQRQIALDRSIKKMNAADKLSKVRSLMAKPENNVQAFVVYSEDAHQVSFSFFSFNL
jgi:hypothetical protein